MTTCDQCLQIHSDGVKCPQRDYLAEAHAILDGTSLLEPERAHLRALLADHHEGMNRYRHGDRGLALMGFNDALTRR
jgi:hypothetical protein